MSEHTYKVVEQADGSTKIRQFRSDGKNPRWVSRGHAGYLDFLAAGNTPVVVPYIAPQDPAPLTLEETKAEKINLIDARTRVLVKQGFPFGEDDFSMSEAAQRNWAALAAAHANGLLTFPLTISTVDESAHTLENETEFLQFLGAYLLYQTDPTQPLGAGRVLKAQVNACTTVEEVEAITDGR